MWSKEKCLSHQECGECTTGGCVWIIVRDAVHFCTTPIDVSGNAIDIIGPLNPGLCQSIETTTPSIQTTPPYVGEIIREQQSLSSSQHIYGVVLFGLFMIVCANLIKSLHRWNRNRHNRQHRVVPVKYRSASAPPTVRLEDVLAQNIQNRANSVEPPQVNILLNPPPINPDDNVLPVYDDQAVIINRNDDDDNDNVLEDQGQQQQQNDEDVEQQQQQQRSLMRASLNCNVQNTFQRTSLELINFDIVNATTLDSDNDVTIL